MHIACIIAIRNSYEILVARLETKRPLGRKSWLEE